jgi:hypothetical protein
MVLFLTATIGHTGSALWLARGLRLFPVLMFQASGMYLQEGTLFNILIALVFGFSTLNIVALATRSLESRPSRLNPGEILALTAMVLSVCFLGWEMLHVFHVFPIQLGN